jgi:hypothetical protein
LQVDRCIYVCQQGNKICKFNGFLIELDVIF